jgi:hypothetical protein
MSSSGKGLERRLGSGAAAPACLKSGPADMCARTLLPTLPQALVFNLPVASLSYAPPGRPQGAVTHHQPYRPRRCMQVLSGRVAPRPRSTPPTLWTRTGSSPHARCELLTLARRPCPGAAARVDEVLFFVRSVGPAPCGFTGRGGSPVLLASLRPCRTGSAAVVPRQRDDEAASFCTLHRHPKGLSHRERVGERCRRSHALPLVRS